MAKEKENVSVLIEELLANEQISEARASYIAEELEALTENPVNLNQPGDLELLESLFLITSREVGKINQHRELYGNFVAVNELVAVEGLERATIKDIRPFVQAEPPSEVSLDGIWESLGDGDWEVMTRYSTTLEERAGFQEEGNYLGSPGSEYFRVNRREGTNLSMGLTATRQSGEPYSGDWHSPVFNFYSGHFYKRGLGATQSLALGDYQLQFGQGLLVWTGFGFGISGNISAINKAGKSIAPYRSRGRSNYFRGAAAEFQTGNWQITPFLSSKNVSATLHEEDGEKYFTSIDEAGYKRTETEKGRNNTLDERIGGFNINYQQDNLSLGSTFKMVNFSEPFQTGGGLRDHFQPEGQQFYYFSLDHAWTYNGLQLFGEAAWQVQGGVALKQGLTLSLHEDLDAGLVARSYQPGYHPFYSNAFQQGSMPQNEQGLFWIMSWRPSPEWQVTGYADHYRDLWVDFLQARPAPGREYRLEANYEPGRNDFINARYTFQEGQQNRQGSIKQEKYQQHRGNMRFRKGVSSSLRGGIGVYTSFHREGGEYLEPGSAVYNEWMYRPDGEWDVTFRYTLFSANAFENRIYLYEHSVLYDFSFPFLMDEGQRANLVIKRELGREWDAWLKIGRSSFFNTHTVSSGPREIQAPHETDVTLQLRWRR